MSSLEPTSDKTFLRAPHIEQDQIPGRLHSDPRKTDANSFMKGLKEARELRKSGTVKTQNRDIQIASDLNQKSQFFK